MSWKKEGSLFTIIGIKDQTILEINNGSSNLENWKRKVILTEADTKRIVLLTIAKSMVSPVVFNTTWLMHLVAVLCIYSEKKMT